MTAVIVSAVVSFWNKPLEAGFIISTSTYADLAFLFLVYFSFKSQVSVVEYARPSDTVTADQGS